jgi:hypothetical protein
MRLLLIFALFTTGCGTNPLAPTPTTTCAPRLPIPTITRADIEISRTIEGNTTTVGYMRPDDLLYLVYVNGKVCDWDTSDN